MFWIYIGGKFWDDRPLSKLVMHNAARGGDVVVRSVDFEILSNQDKVKLSRTRTTK